ncbi:MAG: TIM-barrel domain-containing protein [Planctomycetota bacterium]
MSIPRQRFVTDLLDIQPEASAESVIWRADRPTQMRETPAKDIELDVPFRPLRVEPSLLVEPADGEKVHRDHKLEPRSLPIRVSAYGDRVVRITLCADGSAALPHDGPMLAIDESLQPQPLRVQLESEAWSVLDERGQARFRIERRDPVRRHWSDLVMPPAEGFVASVLPDGHTDIPFSSHDQFFPKQVESLPLGFVTSQGRVDHTAFSIHAGPQEHFVGTGERFARMDLAGSTFSLINDDGLGVNSPRTYKNIPFYLSSAGYGLMVHTSAMMRLSLAGVSTRAAQGVLPDPVLDLFFIAGSPEEILYELRRLTGFPADVPRWSYGVWMSRMTYFSDEEITGIAHRLREERLPCDVLHVDTGWFAKDWVCEWEFSAERFSDPAGFMKRMDDLGFRITLWQTPNIGQGNRLLEEAKENGYLAPRDSAETQSGSDFSSQHFDGVIDFTNPEAVAWYQSLLKRLFDLGAAAIKTDFGENVDPAARYHGLPARLLRNRYALLYQQAAFEATARATSEPIIWARAGWLGSQRYPVHWGGDCACTWDGMAASLRGGLHLGLSGFAFWSHDVPGFHGLPDFMNSWPTDDLYVRWTQFGVFTSHLRYHGTSPREPYDYPAVLDLVRRWWRLRYALIPYLEREGTRAIQTGFPVLRAMMLHHPDDPLCWHIDDQFFCGSDLLVAPVMNGTGQRRVYLPDGAWVDFWTGEFHEGPGWLDTNHPLDTCPVFARPYAEIPFYPEAIEHTGQLDTSRIVPLRFDERYRGLSQAPLAEVWKSDGLK